MCVANGDWSSSTCSRFTVLVKAFEKALPAAQDDQRDRDRELLDVSGAQRLADHVRPTPMPTSFPPAASRARATASSMPFTNAGVQHAFASGQVVWWHPASHQGSTLTACPPRWHYGE